MKVTIELIRSFSPCYDPVTGLDHDGQSVNEGYLPENYEATILEFLRHPKIPAQDKIWVILRRDFIRNKTLRIFAVWCAREAIKLEPNANPICVNAINTAEAYAYGQADWSELREAERQSLSVAIEFGDNIAYPATQAANPDEAIAAREASRSSAVWAAWRSARAAKAARRAALRAAQVAAHNEAREAQLKKLISMIENPTLHEGA